jgi:hypothetical protein
LRLKKKSSTAVALEIVRNSTTANADSDEKDHFENSLPRKL